MLLVVFLAPLLCLESISETISGESMYRESLKSAKHVARSKREACLWKTTYRRSTEGQKNLNNSKAPASCCLTLEPEKQGARCLCGSPWPAPWRCSRRRRRGAALRGWQRRARWAPPYEGGEDDHSWRGWGRTDSSRAPDLLQRNRPFVVTSQSRISWPGGDRCRISHFS